MTWFTSYIQVRTFEWSDLPRPAIGQSQVIDKPIGNLSETGDEGETVRIAGQRADQPATRDKRLTLENLSAFDCGINAHSYETESAAFRINPIAANPQSESFKKK